MVGNKLYLFGGITSSFSTMNDLWTYDLKTNALTRLIADSAAGSPPSRHEAETGSKFRSGKLVIYGGETLGDLGFETLGDSWEYNITKNSWREITPAAEANLDPARNLAGAGILGQNLYLHGGDLPGGSDCCGAPFPQNVSSELWKFSLQKKTWTHVTEFKGTSPALKRHRGIELGNKLFLFGGYDFRPEGEAGQVWNLDVYSFQP